MNTQDLHTIQVRWDLGGDRHPATDREAQTIARDYLKLHGDLDGCPKFVDIIDGTDIPAMTLIAETLS